MIRTCFLSLSIFLFPLLLSSQGRTTTSLNGPGWSIVLDPVKIGEKEGWTSPDFAFTRFDKVSVPHSFSVDPRYLYYTGTAWYFRKFNAPASVSGQRSLIKFDAVFYKARVWVNGKMVREHEGGYTPFEVDVTDLLKGENSLAVQVNNAWDTTSIPGAKTYTGIEQAANGQFYPWINYGGITRPVSLITRPANYIRNVKMVTEPDLVKGSAALQLTARITNRSQEASNPTVTANIYYKGNRTSIKFKPLKANLQPGATTDLQFEGTLGAKEVKLWNQDQPELYESEVITGTDTLRTSFGIRSIKVSGTKLLLNGEPIRMGGCNRPLDYPGYGSMDPDDILFKDLTLLKNGSMELSRISHYPVSESLLDWADKNGLLIIGEAGNWQMTTKQMSDPLMRAKFQSQLTEMIERDWNHPSLIAWSMGNEFHSHTEEGKSWVRDMRAFTLGMDKSRLITFASMFVARDIIKKPEDEASQYVDFISTNNYGNYLKALQHIHDVYPDKPVFMSEFGIRADNVKSEEDRVKHLQQALVDFRKCDYLVGASIWTFNDYRSRFPGTNANGYRPWGLVGPDREIRGMYTAWQEELAPATIVITERATGKVTFKVTARPDFPSYILRGYQLKAGGQTIPLKVLKPGESQLVTIESSGTADMPVSLIKPGGFVILTRQMR